MQTGHRKQSDPKQDEASQACVIHMDPRKDRTRQEFKKEADANDLLQRFGASSLINLRQPTYGMAIDYDMDLQKAKEAVSEARAAFNRLPTDLKRKYPTWEHVLAAIERGEITEGDFTKKEDTKSNGTPSTEAESKPDVRSGAATGSNNDSAGP